MDVKTILLYEVSVKYTPSQVRNTWLLTDKASADKIGELLENYFTFYTYGNPNPSKELDKARRICTGLCIYVKPIVCMISEPNDILIIHDDTLSYSKIIEKINNLMNEIKDKDTEPILEILGEIPPSKLKIMWNKWMQRILHDPKHYDYSIKDYSNLTMV